VIQTMEYTLSKCFKDTHPPFAVSPQVRSRAVLRHLQLLLSEFTRMDPAIRT
jgi:hypothetical protein